MSLAPRFAALALLFIFASRMAAQTVSSIASPTAIQTAEPGSELSVTLVTFGLGDGLIERFGHNVLWIHDASTGSDIGYHWGLFGFDEPHFLQRFLTGDNRYWMGAVDVRAQIEREQSTGRPATLQRLNLTPLQAFKLRDFVQWNARDENKYYRYDYYRDNCSTRLRDALDMAIGGAIKRATLNTATTLSYRRESIRLTDGIRPAQTGIDIALGRPADAPLTQWQSFFIPMRLRDAVRSIRVTDASGNMVPLVAQETTLPMPIGIKPIEELAAAPSIALRQGIVGLLIALVVVGLRVMMVSRRGAAWTLALFGATWSLASGLIGVILLLAWMFTRHVFWAANENVLLFTPVSLILVPLIPAAILSRRFSSAAKTLSAAVATLAALACALALAPGGEENRAVVALMLPTHVALAWVLWTASAATRGDAATNRAV